MNAGRTKKKRGPLAEYADILRRVERHAEDMRKRAEAEARAIFELAHGCGKKTEACEDANRPETSNYEDMKEIHLPLAVAMREGGDPFPVEWEKLRGALAIENLPEIRDEAIRLHDSFVALFPTDATQYGWQTIEDSANAFATFLDGLSIKKEHRRNIKHIPYKVALAILKKLNCPRDRKTIKRWLDGQNTPEGFTPECMATVQAFLAWATTFAHREQAKINTNNALRIDNPDNRKMRRFK